MTDDAISAAIPESDSTTTVGDLRSMVREFVSQRDWQRFHAPKNISMALAVEAAELMEHFQWMEVDGSRTIREQPAVFQGVREEIADVVCYAMALCNELDIDLAAAMREKMVKNREKYPIEEARNMNFDNQ
jgi:dCTP diphosphatase